MLRLTILLASAVCLTACAAPTANLEETSLRTAAVVETQPTESGEAKVIYTGFEVKKPKLHCTRDRITGSHKKRTRCITQAQRQAEEDAAREFLRKHSRGILGR